MNTINLLSIFAENKPGFLAKVTQILADSNVNILWFKIIDGSGDKFGVIRLLVEHQEKAFTALKENGFIVSKVPALAVFIGAEDHPGTLAKLTASLYEKNISIHNGSGYSFHGNTVLLIETEQIEEAFEVLKEHGYKLLKESDIS